MIGINGSDECDWSLEALMIESHELIHLKFPYNLGQILLAL